MKQGLFALLLLTITSLAFADDEILSRSGTPITVALTTSSWTQVDTSTSHLAARSHVCLSNSSGNSGTQVFVFQTSAPSVATTTWTHEIETGENACWRVGNDLKVYGVSGNTSAESVQVTQMGSTQ